MPQLDFVTNVSIVHPFLLAIVLGYALSLEYLNILHLDFSEAALSIKSLAPDFLAILTMNVLTFGWVVLQKSNTDTGKPAPQIVTIRTL